MTRSLVLSAVLVMLSSGCKSSSNAAQPVREAGIPDAPETDGGLGGQDGDDDFRPPLVTPVKPDPRAGSDAPPPNDAGVDAAEPVDAAPPMGGTGGGAAGASGAGGDPGTASNDGGPVDPEDDAGTEPPPCTEIGCSCDRICERGIALGCLDEAPLADCLMLCKRDAPGCEAEALAAVRCKAESPDAQYVCDEDLWQFVVLGCGAEDVALQTCLTR